MDTGVTQIMWKEIGIGLIMLYLLRNILDIYMITTYKKIVSMCEITESEIIKKKAKKLLKICNIFSVGPWNKQIYWAYNGLCWLLASLELVEENENQFLQYLNIVKKEEEFEMKPFALALYYRSKGDMDLAMKYYENYLNCNHKDEGMEMILNVIIVGKKKGDDFYQVAEMFKNPAIVKLFKCNGVL